MRSKLDQLVVTARSRLPCAFDEAMMVGLYAMFSAMGKREYLVVFARTAFHIS